MAVTVEIQPTCEALCMYNDPDASTAYSLSGQVNVSLSSPASFFDKKSRTPTLVLRSLTITFEGHSELITPETGYAATRLCTLTRELAPPAPLLLELSSTSGESSDKENGKHQKSCSWAFVFDLPVPGWLPASAAFGNDGHGASGTRYALFAEAKFEALDEAGMRSWSLSTLCSPFASKERTIRAARRDIRLVRYLLPPLVLAPNETKGSFAFPEATYVIDSRLEQPTGDASAPRIPRDVLSKVEVLATIPEVVSVDDDFVHLSIRLRASDLDKGLQERLRLTHFEVMLAQVEQYRKAAPASYTSCYPLPPASAQPPNKPLLNAHNLRALYDIGLISPNTASSGFESSFSLLPPRHKGRHRLPNNGIRFAHEATRESPSAWCKLDMRVPLAHIQPGQDDAWEAHHGRIKALRPTEESPFLCVHHQLDVELMCAYDDAEGGAPATDCLSFGIPIVFARVPSAKKPSARTKPRALSLSSATLPSAPTPAAELSPSTVVPSLGLLPVENALPAYSQLFHANGDRRIDHSFPLPAYSPRGSPVPSDDTAAAPVAVVAAPAVYQPPVKI